MKLNFKTLCACLALFTYFGAAVATEGNGSSSYSRSSSSDPLFSSSSHLSSYDYDEKIYKNINGKNLTRNILFSDYRKLNLDERTRYCSSDRWYAVMVKNRDIHVHIYMYTYTHMCIYM